MATVGSSGQSLRTLLSRYRSAPAGSGSKKLCPASVTRSATSLVTSPARATVPGRSTRMPRAAGWRLSSAASRAPVPPPHVDDGADGVPAAGELDVVVGHAVPGRAHERVELGREPRVGGQVLPPGTAEDPLVGRLPGAHVVEQRPPGVRHPAADPIQINERGSREPRRGRVHREPPGRRLGEDALADQVTQDGVQGAGVAAGRGGQGGDVVAAVRDVPGDAQRGGYPQAPRRGQVEQAVEVDGVLVFYHR